MTVILLQQQFLAEADLLQLLAQFVQLAGQLLALQLLLYQVLQDRKHHCGQEAGRGMAGRLRSHDGVTALRHLFFPNLLVSDVSGK